MNTCDTCDKFVHCEQFEYIWNNSIECGDWIKLNIEGLLKEVI